MSTKKATIVVGEGQSVSALWQRPAEARVVFVLAHGAGAGMQHKSMAAIAEGLSLRGIATLRYQFPYMERGLRRVDSPKVAHRTVRAAVGEAARFAPDLPLFAGGKSFGGRMTSQAQAEAPLVGVRGLVFFGFPLHPAGTPSIDRAEHLNAVQVPILFLQGSRDALADVALLRRVISELGPRASLMLVPDADHSFHVPAKSGRKDAVVLAEILDGAAMWMNAHSG